MASNITSLFIECGFPLRNSRWSWGARNNIGILLRTWTDQLSGNGKYVPVLRKQSAERLNFTLGYQERVSHLRAMWAGDIAGYLLMVSPEDDSVSPRKIRSFEADKVIAIKSLVVVDGDNIWAELGEEVKVPAIHRHAVKFRTFASSDVFPSMAVAPPRPQSTAAYIQTLPKMRNWLIDVARRGATVTYAQARSPFGLKTFEHRHAMDKIGNECVDSHEPILTSLIVDDGGRCSPGFFKEFGRDDEEERRLCYEFWHSVDSQASVPPGAGNSVGASAETTDSLQHRAIRFGKVAMRPDQARFRQRVFVKWSGKCVITGCNVTEALDAAHKDGRNWIDGHNTADDGYLMRKDIHALYDRKLLTVELDGRISFDPRVVEHYMEFAKNKISAIG